MELRRITDRPTGVIKQAAIRPLALRWAAWAERLLRRHAPGATAWYALDAILRQVPPIRRETLVDRRSSLAFGFYLTIPSVRIMVAPQTATLSDRSMLDSAGWGAPLAQIARANTTFSSQFLRARLTERIVALTERARDEQHYHEAPSPFALLRQSDLRVVNTRALVAVERIYARQGRVYEAWGAAPPVAIQIVKQPETPTQPAAANPASRFTPDTAFMPLHHWNSTAPQAAPADIQRLTDQVIQSIDQRLIASRERFGRR